MKIGITMVCLTLSTLVAFGQRTVKGRLVSLEDQAPLPGYNVMEPGTRNGTITDVNGEFTLTVDRRPAIILFPGCFTSLYVEYEDNVDFKVIALSMDTRDYSESKRVERKYLSSRPTRDLVGEVIDSKTKTPVYNCEVR